MGRTIHRYQAFAASPAESLLYADAINSSLMSHLIKGPRLQPCSLLDVALLDPLFVQVLHELLPLHPVDDRAGVAAVAEEGPARQVQSAS